MTEALELLLSVTQAASNALPCVLLAAKDDLGMSQVRHRPFIGDMLWPPLTPLTVSRGPSVTNASRVSNPQEYVLRQSVSSEDSLLAQGVERERAAACAALAIPMPLKLKNCSSGSIILLIVRQCTRSEQGPAPAGRRAGVRSGLRLSGDADAAERVPAA